MCIHLGIIRTKFPTVLTFNSQLVLGAHCRVSSTQAMLTRSGAMVMSQGTGPAPRGAEQSFTAAGGGVGAWVVFGRRAVGFGGAGDLGPFFIFLMR